MKDSSFVLRAILAVKAGAADFVDTTEVIWSTPIVDGGNTGGYQYLY